MAITNTQKEFIKKYVNETIYDKLIHYLERYDIVGKELFECLGKKYDLYAYDFIDIKTSEFLNRIPFYFYEYIDENGRYREVKLLQYLLGIEGCHLHHILDKNYSFIEEKLFNALKLLHFKYELNLESIFNYPTSQAGIDRRTDILFNWLHYIELAEKNNVKDKMPKYLIIEYNKLLESEKMSTMIFCAKENMEGKIYNRDHNGINLEGKFPCNKNKEPFWQWLGIQVEDLEGYRLSVDKYFNGHLFLETNAKSKIWIIDKRIMFAVDSDAWENIYTGPQKTFFDFSYIKNERKMRGYTQKEVAEIIDCRPRTYQNWEYGKTVPDGHLLLRLINLFNIDDVNLCLKKEVHEDTNFIRDFYSQFASIIIDRQDFQVNIE